MPDTCTEPLLDTVERIYVNPDGIAFYRVASRSEPEPRNVEIKMDDGEGQCDCPHQTMTLAPLAAKHGVKPTLDHPRYRCHHITLATRDCLRRQRQHERGE